MRSRCPPPHIWGFLQVTRLEPVCPRGHVPRVADRVCSVWIGFVRGVALDACLRPEHHEICCLAVLHDHAVGQSGACDSVISVGAAGADDADLRGVLRDPALRAAVLAR